MHLVQAHCLFPSLSYGYMVLITPSHPLYSDYHHIPTKARHVHDVSGAGDTLIATFALSDLCGATPEESVSISNYAAGRVCEEVGVVPISFDMLNEMLNHHYSI